MSDIDPIIAALHGVRQYPTDDPIAGIQPPLQVPKPGMVPPPVSAAPNPNQVMSGVGDLTGVNDAVKALRGQMTPEEQQGFAATAAFGLLPGVGELRPVAKAAEELAPPLYSAAAKAIQDANQPDGSAHVLDAQGNIAGRYFGPPTAAHVAYDLNAMPDPEVGFHSSHWDEPNVIAHARMNDRDVPDANGDPKRTLFLEELQSDLHQQGRKQGYANELPPGYTIDDVKDGPTRFGENNYLRLNTPAGTEASVGFDRDDLIANANAREGRRTVPDFPFKSTWPDLMLKRMVRHAAEGGYDQLAWTPGDVQADRYDLSKQLSKVQYEKGGSSGFTPPDEIDNNTAGTLKAYDPSGKQVMSKYVAQDELPDHIGKEAAQKLLDQTPTSGNAGGTALRTQTLSGLDLKVGGEGMRAFYDKMLVDKANAIGKKYGARVTQSPMQTADVKFSDPDMADLDPEGDPELARVLAANKTETPTTKKAWVLPITPELKRAALTKGFPMFAVGGLTALGTAGGQTGGTPPDENAQMLNALRGPSAPGSQPTPPR